MAAPPYPPPAIGGGGAKLTRQYTGLADTFKSANGDESMAASPRVNAVDLTNQQAPSAVLQPLVAGITDPGVAGKQNQDDFFIWQSANGQTIVMGVLDGHGRELGQMAARVAKDTFLRILTSTEGLQGLRTRPQDTLERAFVAAHQAIEGAFRKWYEDAGWTVSKGAGRDGYLTRSRPGSIPQCVHGGTTATIVVLLDGQRLIISNVGDSTAILAGIGEAGDLKSIQEWTPMQPLARAEPPSSAGSAASASGLSTSVPSAVSKSYMELSADHSPESATEFQRMHKFRPHASVPHHPELLFVYDTLTASKTSCPPIFDVNQTTGACNKTERGSYYKNVRCEWASLVSTPPHAAFQDALAFTRSLGDLHLQMYGVTHMPEAWWMDLVVPAPSSSGGGAGGSSSSSGSDMATDGAAAHAGGAAGAPGVGVPVVSHPLALVLCSDGVWDNWRFEDVAGFALDKARVDKVAKAGSAEAAAADLMAANLDRARVNFGSSADNMTALTLYLFPRA